MKVTSISPLVRRRDRFAIFVDGKFSFALSQTALLESKLVNNQEVDSSSLRKLKKLAQTDKTYLNALRYASFRTRSTWELADYLKRKQVDEVSSKKILERLTKLGLLNDENFAKIWVDNRRRLKPSSERRLKLELRQKHVDAQIIQKVLETSELDDKATIKQLIIKKRRQTKYLNDELKLAQYLSRQGFNYDDIKTVLSDLK
ncbi:MAG TPA: RecX family transcriptional regulator [Candidatus Binatia bacterium]|jgi:regulatory protein|nr:RecX family transcriptional regulator [Candidatus Binatia bacterium]